MAEKLPLVYVDGGVSQLPPSDSIVGIAYGSLTAGSGLSGGGDLSLGSAQVDIELAPNPSGLIFVGDSLGLDGVAQATATAALASGNAGLAAAGTALSSGVAAQSLASSALASGNAALDAAVNFVGSSSLRFTAAGTIQTGNPVGLDDSGSVQTVFSQTTENSNPMSFGSSQVFASANMDQISGTYDPVNNKVVFFYRDNVSNNGKSVVGTISGSSISFGSPVTFEADQARFNSCFFDATNNTVVNVYRDVGNGSYLTGVIGTISGTSITFTSPTVLVSSFSAYMSAAYVDHIQGFAVAYENVGFSSQAALNIFTLTGSSFTNRGYNVFDPNFCDYISLVYSPISQAVVISYRDRTITRGKVRAASITDGGSTVTFGTSQVFNFNDTTDIVSAINPSTDDIVVVYKNLGTGYGTSIVVSLSGTSVSFGSAVAFDTSGYSYVSIAFDSFASKYIVAFTHGTTVVGTAVVGTVSGTSISFGTATAFNSFGTGESSTVYCSGENKAVVGFIDYQSSLFYGTAVVASPLLDISFSPKINSLSNFIGVAQGPAISGTSLDVILPRAIDLNQSGLTTGSFYYLNPAASGFTTASGEPTAWSGAYNWGPVAKAVSSSGLLLLNPL